MDLETLFSGPFTPSRWQQLGALLKAMRVVPGAGIRVHDDGLHGTIVEAIRPHLSRPPCPFGAFRAAPGDPTKIEIIGGAVTAGASVHLVDPYPIARSTAKDGVIWLSMEFTANSEDYLILPGIYTSSAPVWNYGESYPDQVIPECPDPDGTAIIPIGHIKVEVEPWRITFIPSGCGDRVVRHCIGEVFVEIPGESP